MVSQSVVAVGRRRAYFAMLNKQETVTDILDEMLAQDTLRVANNGFHIRPDKPPTEEQAQILLQKAAVICNLGARDSSMSMWVVGNIASILKDYNADISVIVKATDHALGTVTSAVRTFEFFRDKRYNLSYTHHKEVSSIRGLSNNGKHLLMRFAEQREWSVATTRRVARYFKHKEAEGNLNLTLAKVGDEAFIALALDYKTTTKQKQLFIHINEGKYSLSNTKPSGSGFIAEVSSIIQSETEPNGGGKADDPGAVQEGAGSNITAPEGS